MNPEFKYYNEELDYERQNPREILAERSNNQPNIPFSHEIPQENPEFSSKTGPNTENHTVEEYIEILIEHQRNCERSGRYVEAEMAKKRVKELKEKDDFSKKSQLKSKHISEKTQLEDAHLNEFNQFNEFWDRKMQEFEEQARIIEQQLLEKHQNELERFVDEMDKIIPVKPKDSAELLNTRKIQESLAKQQNYIDAHKVQQRALQLEKEEFEKWSRFRAQKLRNQRNQFEQKQQNELFALQKRIVSGQEEQKKARAMELERLLQKYQNAKKELETQQQNELLKFEKNAQKTTVSVFRTNGLKNSRYSANSRQANVSMRK